MPLAESPGGAQSPALYSRHNMNIHELIGEIRQWGEAKGITGINGKGTLLGQLSKTQEDLVRMGYGDIRLVHPETPLKPHEWRCDPPPNPISYTVSTSSRRFRCKMCGEKCRSSNQDRGKRDMCRPCEQRYKYDK